MRPTPAVVVIALTFAACRSQPDPVLALVEALRMGAEDRDAQAIAGRLADDFKGNGSVDKAEATATLRRYFAAYESVHLVVYDVTVRRRTEAEADLGFRAEFNGAARRIGGPHAVPPPSAALCLPLPAPRRRPGWEGTAPGRPPGA